MADVMFLEPVFLDDCPDDYDLPPVPTVTNSWISYGIQEGETVAEAIARSGRLEKKGGGTAQNSSGE